MLVGPSGCGKSTLLNLIAGLEPADTGRIELGGRDITRAGPRSRPGSPPPPPGCGWRPVSTAAPRLSIRREELMLFHLDGEALGTRDPAPL